MSLPVLLQLGTLSAEIELSDIEREYDEDKKPIEKSTRLSSGKMVRDVTCWKKIFSMSWKALAHNSSNTIDGRAGADDLEVEAEKAGPLSFKVTKPDSGTDDYSVFVTLFSKRLDKRDNSASYYNVSLELEEQ